MGGGGRTVEYVQAPTYQQAPVQTDSERAFLEQQRTQMAEMQNSYKQNLEALRKQQEAAQQQSNSVLQQLQASALAQQQYSTQNRAELQAANEASSKQLTMLAASRDQAVGQAADARSQQASQTSDMYDRLVRRRRARQVTY
jgi:colicin import membrane protein